MENIIKKWLGLSLLKKDTEMNLQAILRLEKRLNSLEQELTEYRKDNQYLTMCVKGMLDHLDLDWHREEILDPRCLYQPPTIPIIKFTKRTKLKK